MYAGSWTALMSISGLRRTNNKGKGKLRWSHRIEGILGQIDTIATDLGEILLGNPDLLLLRWLALCLDFRESVHQILEKIKSKPYFKWPNKMEGDHTRCK